MRKKKLITDIIVVDSETDLIDNFDKIDLKKDIVFCLPQQSKEKISVSFSGSIRVTMGDSFNISVVQNKFDAASPFRIWKVPSKLKFCVPRGVVPLFVKPSNSRSVSSTYSTTNTWMSRY